MGDEAIGALHAKGVTWRGLGGATCCFFWALIFRTLEKLGQLLFHGYLP